MKARMRVCVFLTALVALAGLGQGDCTREYKGDLVLTGDQRLVITEGTLCVHGDIVLRDDARLEIEGATLRIVGATETLWADGVFIHVRDRARLELRSAHVEVRGATTTNADVNINAYDMSQVRLVSARAQGGARIWVGAFGNSTVQVQDTPLRRVSIGDQASLELISASVDLDLGLYYRGSTQAELNGLRDGFYDTLELSGGGFLLSVKATRVGGWLVAMYENARVTVRNSVLSEVRLGLSNVPGTIEGMKPGFHALWSLYEGREADSRANLTLVDSATRVWVLILREVRVPVTLRDSYLGVLSVRGSSFVLRCESMLIDNLHVEGSHLIADCHSLTLVQGTQLDQARLDLTGDVRFQYTHSKLLWGHSSSIREYEVRVRDREGKPARGVQVKLEDPSGAVVTQTSDQDGVLRFTIRFDDTNYDKMWHLLTPRGDTIVRTPIQFTTSTPLIVSTW